MVERVNIPLSFSNGGAGTLIVSVLPRDKLKLGHLVRYPDKTEPVGTASIQLLESSEYRFEILVPEGSARTDRPEIFQPDTDTGLTGRVRTGLYTGFLPLKVSVGEATSLPVEFEVRSQKLEYLTDYRYMLRDLSDELTEIILNAFGPTEQKLETSYSHDAVTSYHRFCFLRGLIETERFQESLLRIVTSPHRSWESEQFERDISSGIRTSAAVARQIARPGIRRPVSSGRFESLPARLHVERAEETVDNLPNRFVKHALMRWRFEIQHIARTLEEEDPSSPSRRGLEEVASVVEYLDGVIAAPMFREVGKLDQPIGANQVLQRKEGYREVVAAVLQSELASNLSWDGGEDIFEAGKKNVAALYEYWVFLKLAQLISNLCQTPFEFRSLFNPTQNGLRLGLRRGLKTVLEGTLHRLGRTINVQLFFNRTFEKNQGAWSRDMRPDYSIVFTPMELAGSWSKEVWIHFDAKYRVDHIEQLFGGAESIGKDGDVKRTDLLKMHAYKDAIRRSIGAYVLYPGDVNDAIPEYHEMLPGIGAFCLRPSPNGVGTGIPQLTHFINDVVDHLATQLTQDERRRYWHEKVRSDTAENVKLPAASFITEPPLDTVIILSKVRSEAEWHWNFEHLRHAIPVQTDGSFGLDGHELSASLLMLYDDSRRYASVWAVAGGPTIVMRNALQADMHPHFEHPAYLIFEGVPIVDGFWAERIKASDIAEILPNPPRVTATTWARVVEEFYRMGVELGG